MLTLILAASSFTFPGGSAAELCQAMSEATSQPVAIAYMGDARIRAASFSWTDAAKFKENSRSYFAFQKTDGEAFGFGPRTLPDWLLDSGIRPDLPSGGTLTVEDEKIDAVPEKGKYLTGRAVERLSLSKPIHLHWLLQEMPLAIAAKKADEKEFVAAVASALDATLTTKDDYSLELDPKLTKERLAGGYRALSAKSKSRAQSALYSLDADYVSNMTDTTFATAFGSASTSQASTATSGSSLYNSAWAYARAYAAENPAGDEQTRRTRAMVDPRQPVQITFRPRQGVSLAFSGSNGKTLVRLPEARTLPAVVGG